MGWRGKARGKGGKRRSAGPHACLATRATQAPRAARQLRARASATPRDFLRVWGEGWGARAQPRTRAARCARARKSARAHSRARKVLLRACARAIARALVLGGGVVKCQRHLLLRARSTALVGCSAARAHPRAVRAHPSPTLAVHNKALRGLRLATQSSPRKRNTHIQPIVG